MPYEDRKAHAEARRQPKSNPAPPERHVRAVHRALAADVKPAHPELHVRAVNWARRAFLQPSLPPAAPESASPAPQLLAEPCALNKAPF
eukprot:3199253-Prymnesium_polylepis.1